MAKRKMYLVEVVSGHYDDTSYHQVFVTARKSIASRWVNKFNRLIEGQAKRINEGDCMEKYLHDEPTLFWFDYIIYESPKARFSEIEVR
jgi:hypothetical protein